MPLTKELEKEIREFIANCDPEEVKNELAKMHAEIRANPLPYYTSELQWYIAKIHTAWFVTFLDMNNIRHQPYNVVLGLMYRYVIERWNKAEDAVRKKKEKEAQEKEVVEN